MSVFVDRFKQIFPNPLFDFELEIYKYVSIKDPRIFLVLESEYFKMFINWDKLLKIMYMYTNKSDLNFLLIFLDFYIPHNIRFLYSYQNYNLNDFEYLLLSGKFKISLEVIQTILTKTTPTSQYLNILYQSSFMTDSLDNILSKILFKINEENYNEELIKSVIKYKSFNILNLFKFVLQLIECNNIYLFYIILSETSDKLVPYDKYGVLLSFLIQNDICYEIDFSYYTLYPNILFEMVKTCLFHNNLYYFNKLRQVKPFSDKINEYVKEEKKQEFISLL